MADTLQNLKSMFRDSKIRTIFIFTGILMLIGVAIGYIELRNRMAGPQTSAKVGSVPQTLQSIPGGFDNPETAEYVKLQERQNYLQAQKAEKTGGSAIPTITSSDKYGNGTSSDQSGSGNANWQAGAGFSTLNRIQQSGDFTPKRLDLGTGGTTDKGTGTDLAGLKISGNGQDSAVYNDEGCLVGYKGKNKKVCDFNGNVIGTVSPDGKITLNPSQAAGGAAGAGTNPLGRPVYDANGRLIGYAGPDGVVRDANGRVIGTADANGTVRDSSGRVLGQAAANVAGADTTSALGKPVYDANGRLIGYAGPDGVVRDANGRVIGTADANGTVRDGSGKTLGQVATAMGQAAGATTPLGKPVYDANGRLIGYAGPDGIVRDASGKVIGTMEADGTVRDALGIPIVGPGAGASTQASTIPGISGAPPPGSDAALQAIMQRQAAQVSAAQLEQMRQQLQAGMLSQANQLINGWNAPIQVYVPGNPPPSDTSKGSNQAGEGGLSGKAGTGINGGTVMLKAGTVLFAVLDTAVNSDEPGPVMATVVSGPYKGSKLLGNLTNQGQKVLLSFNLLSIPDSTKSITLDAVAIDPNTARTAVSSYTDNHYLLRYGTLFASSFMQGFGQAFQTSGQTISTNGLQTNQTNPVLTGKGKFFVALGTVGDRWGNAASATFNTLPTVHVYSGTGLGILIKTDVTG